MIELGTVGCTNPSAANYDPNASVEDYSCLYLEKVNDTCYLFQDVPTEELKDESFTLSFSLLGMDWVFFHDYVPDFYFSGRNQLFSLKDRRIYIHNKGLPGVYYDGTPKSFLIDAVFTADSEMILNSIQWISEVLRQGNVQEFATCTHITIWNSQQCSGRLSLPEVLEGMEFDVRKTQGVWSFDTFRDQLKAQGTQFLADIFNNFAVIDSALDMNKPWFDQDLLHDNWFVIRFEFDNSSQDQFIFHSAYIDATKSYR